MVVTPLMNTINKHKPICRIDQHAFCPKYPVQISQLEVVKAADGHTNFAV